MNPPAEKTRPPALDDTDKRLLNRMQFDFPLSDRPWDGLAQGTGLTGVQVLSRVQKLKDEGYIRQISAIFDTRALGYSSTLAAARVPEARLDEAAAVVNRHPGVSHNYRRDAEFNMWFTLAVPPGEALDHHLQQLAKEAAFEDFVALPTIKTFRIGVQLDVGDDEQPDQQAGQTHAKPALGHGASEPVPLSETDKSYIRALQDDLPLVDRPFGPACQALGVGFDELRSWMTRMRDAGVMRRFAAILRHRQAGFTANGMVVWQVPESHIETAGRLAADQPEVSHCYQRPASDVWPYNLYTMIHARSEADCQGVIDRIVDRLAPLGVKGHRTLYSTTEYKKQRVRYFV